MCYPIRLVAKEHDGHDALKTVKQKQCLQTQNSLKHCDFLVILVLLFMKLRNFIWPCPCPTFPAGKDVLYNIVSFARDSVHAHVTTLRPDNFPADRKEPWLVDFFAPVWHMRNINTVIRRCFNQICVNIQLVFCLVVSSMSSITTWTEESINPVGWTHEVWYSGLYHPPGPLL